MTDFSKLAGQTVDGWYYLLKTDKIEPSDIYWCTDNVWRLTTCVGMTPDAVNEGVHESSQNYARYRRPVTATQPTQPVAPCSRCEELEALVRLADAMAKSASDASISVSTTYNAEKCEKLLGDVSDYESARARVKIGGESVSD